MQMINGGLLWVETITGDKVVVIEMLDKAVCRVQFTLEGPPKFVLTKPTTTRRKDYNAMSYNYESSSQD